MRFLRTVSTRRLLASHVGALAAVVAGTAIAVAASGSGSGPVPPRTSLAKATHRALAAGKVAGISARISFTNHLISSSDLQGSDPILTGASGRLWLSSGHRLRLELQSDNGDAQIVVNGRSFWVSEPSAHTVYQGTLPASTMSSTRSDPTHALPTVAKIQAELNRIMGHVDLSGAIPGDIAGRPAYTVSVSPKHDGGLLGSAALAWDAARGVPLRFAIYARGSSTPVIELKATHVSFGSVSASTFAVSPPAGAKVVKISMPAARAGAARAAHKHARREGHIAGVAAVSKHVPFPLDAPKSLAGLPRRGVTLLDLGGHPAALVTYGQNLGGIAVIEAAAPAKASAAPQTAGNRDSKGLSLPTVSINGSTGQELDTALGTVVRFTHGGVAFTVLGSVPPVAAETAARGL